MFEIIPKGLFTIFSKFDTEWQSINEPFIKGVTVSSLVFQRFCAEGTGAVNIENHKNALGTVFLR